MQGAVKTMATLNKSASVAMMRVGVNSATDVTGFGLMGHLQSMVRGSKVTAEVTLGSVPVLPGAWDLLDAGIVPGGTHRNVQSVSDTVIWESSLKEREQLLLCDAQTSGGLLVAVTATAVDRAVSALAATGTQAVKIGSAESFLESGPRVYVV